MSAVRQELWLRGGRRELGFGSRNGWTVIAALLLLLCAGPCLHCSLEPEPNAEPSAKPNAEPNAAAAVRKPEQPYSVQMHVHGSFSEGSGSIDSHSFQASELGLDVLWWSDHDFRITSYRHTTRFGFEGREEPIDRNESWKARSQREERLLKLLRPHPRSSPAGSQAHFVSLNPREGERSLRLRTQHAGSDFKGVFQIVSTKRGLTVRPLALRVELAIEIFAEELGDDARAVIEIQLSEHPARLEIPYTTYQLRYVLDNRATRARRIGASYEIPVRYQPGQWNHLSLPITKDAIEGFPFIEGDDNALSSLAVGIEARNSATASALFDDLRIEQEIEGPAGYRRQLELIDRVSRHYPSLRQLQGVELSYGLMHLNVFGNGPVLLDYDALAEESGLLRGKPSKSSDRKARAYSTRRAVEIAHEAGALVSYNHMFGVGFDDIESHRSSERVAEYLAKHGLFGVDILEIGYRDRGGHDLRDHLEVWDRLARAGFFPVGTGVSDSHGGQGAWRTASNNFVSWIYAPEPTRPELVAGLRAGRVFFGDLVDFDGELDLTTERGAVMGQIVLTDRDTARATIRARGLAAGDVAVIVESGERVERLVVGGSSFEASRSLELGERGAWLRVEVYDRAGRAKVFSNAIHFVRELPSDGLPPERMALDLAGARSRSIEGLWIRSASVALDSGRREIRIAARAASGRMLLDTSGFADTAKVTLEGITGSWRREGTELLLFDLKGEGTLRIAPAGEGQ